MVKICENIVGCTLFDTNSNSYCRIMWCQYKGVLAINLTHRETTVRKTCGEFFYKISCYVVICACTPPPLFADYLDLFADYFGSFADYLGSIADYLDSFADYLGSPLL